MLKLRWQLSVPMFDKRNFSQVALVVFSASLLVGCASATILPHTAQIRASEVRGAMYPFVVTIESYERVGFNVHTFSPGYEKVSAPLYIYLKRDSGTLRTGEFSVGSGGLLMPSRGTIVLTGNKLVIHAEVAVENGGVGMAQSSWRESLANGEYELRR